MDLLTRAGYNWPGLHKPMDHQRVTSEFLVQNPRCFNLNDIGTGKTLSSLWAADFLMRQGAIRKVLIGAPLSTLWDVWAKEIYSHMDGRTYGVLHGSKSKRLQVLSQGADFFIINHDGFKVINTALAAHPDIDLIILDEGAEFKNARTDRWRFLNSVAGPVKGKGLWWTTGSPMPGGPTDIWAQARLVNPTLVPRLYTKFRADVMWNPTTYVWLPRKGWETYCYGMLQPSIRYVRDDCIDLPPVTTQTRFMTMDNEQKEIYDQMFNTFVIEMQDGKITAANEGVKRLKLMQIATGAVYDGDEVTHFLPCKNKLSVLKESIHQAGNKAIVFAPFKHSIPLLSRALQEWKLSYTVVHGGVSTRKRSEAFNAFQDGDTQILLAHPQCMAHGLTLTASHTVIWWAPVSFKIYEQANGRITRPGQRAPQTIIHIMCSEVERRAYQKIKNKESMQGLLLDMLKEKVK